MTPIFPVPSLTLFESHLGPPDKIVKSWSFYKAFTQKIVRSSTRYAAYRSLTIKSLSLYESIPAKIVTNNTSFVRAFYRTRRVFYITNLATGVTSFLGELLDGQTTLTDVSIPDGDYNIEVRTSQDWWDEARSRIVFPVQIQGGVILSEGVPGISVLTAEITRAYSTKLRWEIPDSLFQEGMYFGIWRSPTPSVDTSGPPDFTRVGELGLGKYYFNLTQTADEYFAVAAIVGSDQGAAREVFHAWNTSAPTSPDDQYGFDTEE